MSANVEPGYSPPAELFGARRNETRHPRSRTRKAIVFNIPAPLSSTDTRAALRAGHIQIQLAQRADAVVKRRVFDYDACVKQPLYCNLYALRIQICTRQIDEF
jgi:hypothetical protein